MYDPTLPPVLSDEENNTLLGYLYGELREIAGSLQSIGQGQFLPVLHAEPSRPREFQFAFADGSDWNPGSGEGLYMYYNATWNLVVINPALYLLKANNLSDVANAASSASNIGVGTEDTPQFTGAVLTDNLVVPKTSGKGILIEPGAATYGWRDLLGRPQIKVAGANDPEWVVYRGNIYQFRLTAGKRREIWFEYHIPHDYVPGTDLYIHAHWSQIVVDTGGTAGVPGVIKWYFDFTYSDGHGTAGGTADPFPAEKTISVTQQGSTTQYGHMIAEVAITNNGGDATHLDRNTIVVDGLILVRAYRDSTDVADTLNQEAFVHFIDIHYQSTNVGTKQKAPNFYV